jgi:hypothetical protein
MAAHTRRSNSTPASIAATSATIVHVSGNPVNPPARLPGGVSSLSLGGQVGIEPFDEPATVRQIAGFLDVLDVFGVACDDTEAKAATE